MTTNDIAAINDKFRKTVPLASVLVPDGLEPFSPLLGVVDDILEKVMDFEFPVQEEGDRDQGSLKLCEGVVVKWEILKEHKEQDSRRHTKGYHCIYACTDIFQARRSKGIPWHLVELQSMYESQELVVYLPNVRFETKGQR